MNTTGISWVLALLALGLATSGCGRKPVASGARTESAAARSEKHEFRFCPAETRHVAFVRDATSLMHLDDETWGFPLVSAVPSLLEDAGLARNRIRRLEAILVGRQTAFLFETPDARLVVERLQGRGQPTRVVEGDTIYQTALQPEEPSAGAWGWVLVEPEIAAVGNVNALEEILHTARGRNESLREARPELHRVMRTGKGCDTASYIFTPRKGLEILEGFREILKAIGLDHAFMQVFPMPHGMLLGGTRGKSKAAGFLAFDLGNAALARFIVKWGKLLSLGMHFGLLENLPEIDHTEVDQEAGMVRILLHMRGTMWDANLVKFREKSLEWERLKAKESAFLAQARQVLAPGKRFEVTSRAALRTDTFVVEVLQRAWNGARLELRMQASGDSAILGTNYGSIALGRAADGSEIHVRVNAGTPAEQALRIDGNRLVGQGVSSRADIV